MTGAPNSGGTATPHQQTEPATLRTKKTTTTANENENTYKKKFSDKTTADL
jgi:hypothetical protein